MEGFSRDAQLQATVNTSCWHKEFVMEIINGQLTMAYVTLARTLCSGEEPNVIIRYLSFCYRSKK